MNIEILDENKASLDNLKKSIAAFASPKILDGQMRLLKKFRTNIDSTKLNLANCQRWLKENKKDENYDQYSAFLKTFEKRFAKIQEFEKRFSQNKVKRLLGACARNLVQMFDAKATLKSQTYSFACSNFVSDLHAKAILVENKFQRGAITANNAYTHMSKLSNGLNANPLSISNDALKNMFAAYMADYSKKATALQDGGIYTPDSVLHPQTSQICRAENLASSEIDTLMDVATSRIINIKRRLHIKDLNNSLADAQKIFATIGTPEWDEKSANNFLDNLYSRTQEYEKLQTEIDDFEFELSSTLTQIETATKHSQEAAKAVLVNESATRIEKVKKQIVEVKHLAKGKTPTPILVNHQSYIKNEINNIQETLGKNAVDDLLTKLNEAKMMNEELNTLISQISMQELAQEKVEEQEKVLTYKPDFDTNDPNKDKK